MLEVNNLDVYGFDAAIRGMRNPMNSWPYSDRDICREVQCGECIYNENCPYGDHYKSYNIVVGPNDLDLMLKLCKAGPDHRKFLRMIVVYLDITAPLYWWKEFDTYKVGTVANSCSTMHKLCDKRFEFDDFSHEWLLGESESRAYSYQDDIRYYSPQTCLGLTIEMLNKYRDLYLNTKEKQYWWQMIQLLPSSYNQKRTVMLNYEVLRDIYHARKDHKLNEWQWFCEYIKNEMPYSQLITGEEQ